MSFKSDFETVVLGCLQGASLHGYEISKRISNKSDGLVRIGEGQLYPLLHKLEERALVSSEWIGQEGKPARKVYSLTEAGAAALVTKKESWDKFVQGVRSIIAHPKEAASG